MKLNEYQSGTFKQQYQYKSFSPSLINHDWVWDNPEINVLMETATQALAEFNAYSLIVPDVDLFIEMHIAKEANQSSKIEGTQTNIKDVVLDKKDVAAEKRDDWQEVHNYIDTINYATNELKRLPLSSRLLKECHKTLMKSVRGEHKSPGEFRKSQNWIGGSNLKDAAFIPPHESDIAELISDLEKFWHNMDINVPHLIKIAISHYQFETIHPFLDGNGRIGRLMITLYLLYFGFLSKPALYLSDFFEKHRNSYYNALTIVRTQNDMLHWIKFFLNAIIDTSNKGKDTFARITQLKNSVEADILKLNKRAENAKKLLQVLYKKPIIDYQTACDALQITARPANDLLKAMVDLGILVENTGLKRNKKYAFSRYLDIFSES